jgi:hypothetical protein
MSRWPVAFFTWALVIVGLVSVAASILVHERLCARADLESACKRRQFSIVPAIATTPNSGSCTSCHSLTGNNGATLCGVSSHRGVCGDDDQAA